MQGLSSCIFFKNNHILTRPRKGVIIFRAYNHMVVAFALYLAFGRFMPGYSTLTIGTFIFGLAWLFIASILPDIDHPRSLISGFMVLPIFTIFSGHRKETHSLLALIISGSVFWAYDPWYGACYSLGYFSHLLADTLTVSGVPWLYGFRDKNYSLRVCRTGSLGEYGVVLVCIQYILFKMK